MGEDSLAGSHSRTRPAHKQGRGKSDVARLWCRFVVGVGRGGESPDAWRHVGGVCIANVDVRVVVAEESSARREQAGRVVQG
jgi:hypothetical protein